MATIARPEATLTMWPRLRSRCGIAAAVVVQAPRRLISRVARACASGAAPASWAVPIPALFTRTSIPPRRCAASSIAVGLAHQHLGGGEEGLGALRRERDRRLAVLGIRGHRDRRGHHQRALAEEQDGLPAAAGGHRRARDPAPRRNLVQRRGGHAAAL